MIRNSDVEIVQGDSEQVIIPVADNTDPDNDFFRLPSPSEIRYVIAEKFNPDNVLYTASDADISVKEYSSVEPQDPDWPYPSPSNATGDGESYPRPADTTNVILITIPFSETRNLPVTDSGGGGLIGGDGQSLVHECEIGSDTSASTKLTVMQGEVTVLPSATSDV